MSEVLRSEQPEIDIELIAQKMIANWQRGLPSEIPGWRKKEEGEVASPEEIFTYYDKYVEELQDEKNKKREEFFAKNVEDESNTNNFHLFFRPKLCRVIASGKIAPLDVWGVRSHYINSRFENAWNEACELFYNEVVVIVGFEEGGYRRRKPTDAEKESLKKIAIFLMGKGVPASFLCG